MKQLLTRVLPLALILLLSPAALAQKPADSAPATDAPPAAPPAGLTPVIGRNTKYVVKPGEDLYTLGLRHHLAIEHLMWANGLPSEQASAGAKITIPLQHVLPATLEEGLVINLPERGVYLFKNKQCVAFYPCAIGMGGRFSTPTGDTRIVNKQVDPTWDPPEWANVKEPVGPGPSNPLGDRWIGLGIDGVGLHGTTQPMSIGQAASHGCMRMYPSVIRLLFEQVKVGMPVRIVYETVKLGMSPDDNKIYVQIYPDVYGRVADRAALLREKLDRAGLGAFVSDTQIQRLVADKSGLPQSVVGEDIVVKVNNQRVATSLAPYRKDGLVWTSSEVVRALGARMRYDDKTLTVTLNGKTVRFEAEPSTTAVNLATAIAASPGPTTDDASATTLSYTPQRWNGRTIVPVKPLLQTFGLTYKWVPEHKTLLIYSPYQSGL